jgi:hypothetical protein
MKNFQPTSKQSIAGIPQTPPWQSIRNQHVFVAPQLQTPPTLPYTPLPIAPSPRQQGSLSYATMHSRQFLIRRAQTFQPATTLPDDDAYIFPLLKLPATPGPARYIPQPPGPLNYMRQSFPPAPVTGVPSNRTPRESLTEVSKTPPCSIPGYFPRKSKLQEPGIAETLLGCGTLMLIGIVLLAALYYLSL